MHNALMQVDISAVFATATRVTWVCNASVVRITAEGITAAVTVVKKVTLISSVMAKDIVSAENAAVLIYLTDKYGARTANVMTLTAHDQKT